MNTVGTCKQVPALVTFTGMWRISSWKLMHIPLLFFPCCWLVSLISYFFIFVIPCFFPYSFHWCSWFFFPFCLHTSALVIIHSAYCLPSPPTCLSRVNFTPPLLLTNPPLIQQHHSQCFLPGLIWILFFLDLLVYIFDNHPSLGHRRASLTCRRLGTVACFSRDGIARWYKRREYRFCLDRVNCISIYLSVYICSGDYICLFFLICIYVSV